MAVSDTTSSLPAGWSGSLDMLSIGQPPPLVPALFGPSSDLIVVVTAASNPATMPSGGAAPRSGWAEGGRMARSARRRSRTSRKAPVTLLNTDTSNFRAMVQQFTGFPPPPPPPTPYSSSSYRPAGFGLGFGEATVAPLGQFQSPHQYLEQQYHHHQQQYQRRPVHDAMFRREERSNVDGSRNEVFLHNSGTSMEMVDAFLFGAMPSQMTIRPSSTDD